MVNWPNQPALPSGLPLGWTTPPAGIPEATSLAVFTSQQIEALRINFQNALTEFIVLAVQGFLTAGQDAFEQLSNWASGVYNGAVVDIAALISNAGVATIAAVGQLLAAVNSALNQISDIFNGIVVTPINTVVQQIKDWWDATGTDLPTAITNAGSAVGDIASIVSNAGESLASAVGTAIANAGAAIDDVVDNVIGGAVSAVTTFGQAWEGAFAGWLNAIDGGSATTAQTTALSAALLGQKETIVDISTAVLQLQAAAAAAGSSGIFGGDDFERTEASNLGGTGYWTETYSGGDSSDGYIAIANGHQAAWETGDPVTRSVFCRRTATDDQYTQTNYQKISWTIGSNGAACDPSGDPLWVRLYGRVSDDESSLVFVEVSKIPTTTAWYTYQFGYRTGGSDTYIGSPQNFPGTNPYVPAGSTLTFWVGDPDVDERYFKLTKNASNVGNWDDSSTNYSTIGASNLGWGFGAQAVEANGGGVQADPPSLDSITIADNGPGAFDFASLPAAGNAGRTYWCEDVGLTLLDDGTDWRRVWGGPLGYFTEPPSTGWSAVNAGSTTFAANKDALLFTAPSDGTGSYHLQVRTLTPSSNYTARFNIELTAMDSASTDAWAMGIVLRESSSGKFLTLELVVSSSAFGSGALLRAGKWTNTSTFSAAYKSRYVQFLSGGIPNWLQFRDNGTTRYFEYSHNGVDYVPFHPVGRTDFCTPDQIGVGVFNANTGYTNYLRMRSLDGVS